MAQILLGAATLAYRKAVAKTREEARTNPATPGWLTQFSLLLEPDNTDAAPTELNETTLHRKQRLLSTSTNRYEQLAWIVYKNITSKQWFDMFIMLNIAMVAISTGIDLENEDRKPHLVTFSNIVSTFTLIVFTIECMLKIIAEGYEPWIYFTDKDHGYFNIFDFLIVFFSLIFIQSGASNVISILRVLRLIRLLDFIKNVPQLKMILSGLIQGIKSVSYILILLFLVLYIFAIVGALLFGDNDPAHFGSVGISMITLFQVSTLASWTSIAYISWYGCKNYLGSPYEESNEDKIRTMAGTFQGYKCTANTAHPIATGIFFAIYILLTSWVVMEDGSWNTFDFIVVLMGIIELTPAKFLFKNFPIVILRLIRLLRVFKLAKTFPRLRAIVEALMSSFAAVGWVCGLIFVFNYIAGCLCVVLFRENDPFHFGNVGRAMFSVLRIETLDTWDQLLYLAMYGCKHYSNGYELVQQYPQSTCDQSSSMGYFAVPVIFFIAIIGAYVLPTCLVGIVSIKFDIATKALAKAKLEKEYFIRHLVDAKKVLPDFFTIERIEAIEDLFVTLDANKEQQLDLNEISPFLQYSLDYLFDVEISPQQCEALFFLIDSDQTTEIGLGEFVYFISVLKQMHIKKNTSQHYADRVFSSGELSNNIQSSEGSNGASGNGGGGGGGGSQTRQHEGKSKWDSAMVRLDKEYISSAWDAILTAIHGTNGYDLTTKITTLFNALDSDDSGELDTSELGEGLKACNIRLNERQIVSLINHMDSNGSGCVNLNEFIKQVTSVMKQRADLILDEKLKELHMIPTTPTPARALSSRNHLSYQFGLDDDDEEEEEEEDDEDGVEDSREATRRIAYIGGDGEIEMNQMNAQLRSTSSNMEQKKKFTAEDLSSLSHIELIEQVLALQGEVSILQTSLSGSETPPIGNVGSIIDQNQGFAARADDDDDDDNDLFGFLRSLDNPNR